MVTTIISRISRPDILRRVELFGSVLRSLLGVAGQVIRQPPIVPESRLADQLILVLAGIDILVQKCLVTLQSGNRFVDAGWHQS
jgi:hypothetical protein